MTRLQKPERITAPFADIHRAKLERLVREWWEYVEAIYAMSETEQFDSGVPLIGYRDQQILCAADAYLRATKGEG